MSLTSASSPVDEGVIHPATRLGAVHLTVADLERSLAFYQAVLGFQVQARGAGTADLGAGREALVVLTEEPGARPVRHHSGLYHFAILTPSRLALARVLRNLIATETRFGGSDHLVSEALYLSDPDGNGIEVYRDRPRSTWTYARGQLTMDTIPLDYPGILAELGADPTPWTGLEPGTVLGHMHLHVADLPGAVRFYRDTIGLGLMTTFGEAAAFLSAGGYHHHLGLNTWAGVGAPPPPPGSVGLRHFVVVLPSAAERDRLRQRLADARVAVEERVDGLFVRDPSQNGVLFVVGAPRD
jgi:catechol 2,3-dioxygenase